MPHNHEWQTRIKAVERDHASMRLATDRLLESAYRDPRVLQGDLRYRDVVHASAELEGTYIIRLFAEFETGLRLFWDAKRDSNPRTRDLLDGIAAMCGIPDDQRDHAHLVREHRNRLVHEREEEVEALPIAVSRGYLCHYFSFLPPKW